MAGDSLRIVSEETLTDSGAPPVPFSIAYEPGRIDTTRRYLLEARVVDPQGMLLFENHASFPVITGGYPDSADVLVHADRRARSAPTVLAPGNLALRSAEERAAGIEARRRSLPSRTGEISTGDGVSRFTAVFEANQLRVVEEHFDAGTRPYRRTRYYFDDDVLFYVVSDDPGDAPGDGVRMAFDAAGSVEAAARVEDGVEAPLDPQEGTRIRGHLIVLRAAAQGLRR
jgi:hypothetical protein